MGNWFWQKGNILIFNSLILKKNAVYLSEYLFVMNVTDLISILSLFWSLGIRPLAAAERAAEMSGTGIQHGKERVRKRQVVASCPSIFVPQTAAGKLSQASQVLAICLSHIAPSPFAVYGSNLDPFCSSLEQLPSISPGLLRNLQPVWRQFRTQQ